MSYRNATLIHETPMKNEAKKFSVCAFQIAGHINIREFKKAFSATPVYSDSNELLYINGDNQYLYVLSFGVLVFVDYSELDMSQYLEFAEGFCRQPLHERMREDISITHDPILDQYGYNDITISQISQDTIKIIMINIGQSVALDYFSLEADKLLEEARNHTLELEQSGKISISGQRLKKFIARVLNIRNQIAENLYILDSPAETWEDEYLGRLDTGLKRHFEITPRYRSLNENLQIIKENLDLFKDLMQHQKSSMLEWIIILLILVEVINMFLEKILK